MQPLEQGFLSPPISSQFSSHLNKKKTLRGALGAITPDLYFTGTVCSNNAGTNENGGVMVASSGSLGERINDNSLMEEGTSRLHIRTLYDEHRNDFIVNIIEGTYIL